MLRYIATSKIKNKPLTDTKYDFSIIVEKMENWIGRTVHGPVYPLKLAWPHNISGKILFRVLVPTGDLKLAFARYFKEKLSEL